MPVLAYILIYRPFFPPFSLSLSLSLFTSFLQSIFKTNQVELCCLFIAKPICMPRLSFLTHSHHHNYPSAFSSSTHALCVTHLIRRRSIDPTAFILSASSMCLNILPGKQKMEFLKFNYPAGETRVRLFERKERNTKWTCVLFRTRVLFCDYMLSAFNGTPSNVSPLFLRIFSSTALGPVILLSTLNTD